MPFSYTDVLSYCQHWHPRNNYFSYFHFIMKSGIIWRDKVLNSKKIFTLQKKTVKITFGAKPGNLGRSLYRRLEYLPLACEYIFSLMNNTVSNQEYFQTNASVHSVHTRNKCHPHRPITYLSCFQKSTHCAGVKILNILPSKLTRMKMLSLKFK